MATAIIELMSFVESLNVEVERLRLEALAVTHTYVPGDTEKYLNPDNNLFTTYSSVVTACNEDEDGMLLALESARSAIRLAPVALKFVGSMRFKTNATIVINDLYYTSKEFINGYSDINSLLPKENIQKNLMVGIQELLELNPDYVELSDDDLLVLPEGLSIDSNDLLFNVVDIDGELVDHLDVVTGYTCTLATNDEMMDAMDSTGTWYKYGDEFILEDYDGILLAYIYPRLVVEGMVDDALAMLTIMKYKENIAITNGDISSASTLNYIFSNLVNGYNNQQDIQSGINTLENQFGL